MGQSSWIHLENCEILKETGSAFLIVYNEGKHWIPKSQISKPDTYNELDKGVTISITEWIAEQKGIEVDE